MRTLLLATTNPSKLATLRRLVEGLPLGVLTPAEAGVSVEAGEGGPTHRAIAEAKALEWSRAWGGLALASDGGVSIPALEARGLWDSRRTRRSAGANATDAGRVASLLRLAGPLRGEERRIVWREAVALADAGRLLASWEAEGVDGALAESFDPRRVNPNFWVATVWEVGAAGKRYMDCSEAELAAAGDHWARLAPLVRAALSGLP